jgi:hypothetical protein
MTTCFENRGELRLNAAIIKKEVNLLGILALLLLDW